MTNSFFLIFSIVLLYHVFVWVSNLLVSVGNRSVFDTVFLPSYKEAVSDQQSAVSNCQNQSNPLNFPYHWEIRTCDESHYYKRIRSREAEFPPTEEGEVKNLASGVGALSEGGIG